MSFIYQKNSFIYDLFAMQWMADLDVDLFFQINFPKKLDHRLSMGTHFCKFFEDFATLLYLNANL